MKRRFAFLNLLGLAVAVVALSVFSVRAVTVGGNASQRGQVLMLSALCRIAIPRFRSRSLFAF